MDDALRRRLDRLTYLVAGLLAAVLALGYYVGGGEYVTTVVGVLVVGVIAGVVAAGLPALAEPWDDDGT